MNASPSRIGAGRTTAMTGILCIFGMLTSACFSDRANPTSMLPDDCTLPVELVGKTQTIIAIQGFTFQPAEVRVPAGTTVTWVNCEPPGTEAHTSTSDETGWSSPLLVPGEAFSVDFDAPGSFDYHCMPHPGMQATIIVE